VEWLDEGVTGYAVFHLGTEEDGGVFVIPLEEDAAEGEFGEGGNTFPYQHECEKGRGWRSHFMLAGRTMGSRARFLSTSSMSATFHRRRRICHIPR